MTNVNGNGTGVIAETNTTNEVPDLQLDQYGRDEAERTVILSSEHAEAVDQEVTNGKHDTFDEGLAYIIVCGLREIKRVREASEARKAQQLLAKKSALYDNMLKLNRDLVNNPDFVQKMIADLVTKQKSA